MPLKYFLLILISGAIFSCRNGTVKVSEGYHPGKDEMADINRYIIQKDKERIQSYSERKELVLKESPTGLWYNIIKEGEGSFFKEYDRITFEYECSLLDGTRCYSSAELGPKEIILGRSELPAGLNEGFKLLKPGGLAIFVMPPFLAYGLVGDGKKIPPRSTLVYRVTVIPN